MAKLRMGILDGFQGRVGPVVGYRLGSKWIMRRLPQQVCNPRTERQVAHRMMFRDIVRLASALLPALKVGYRAQAGLWEMTEGNAFVKMNWLRDRMPGFNELRISVGAVPMVGFTRVSMEGGRLEAQWEKNQQLAGYTHVWAVMEDRMGRTSNSLYLEPLELGDGVLEVPVVEESVSDTVREAAPDAHIETMPNAVAHSAPFT